MSRMVLRTMRVMMKYSKGEETTTLHSLYLKLSLSFGMYRSRGSAFCIILQDHGVITIGPNIHYETFFLEFVATTPFLGQISIT